MWPYCSAPSSCSIRCARFEVAFGRVHRHHPNGTLRVSGCLRHCGACGYCSPGAIDVSDAKRLKQMDEENRRLKRIVADQALDIQMLKDVASKNW